jgi:hypothetical protein
MPLSRSAFHHQCLKGRGSGGESLTLILTLVSKVNVVQVSDRRTSWIPGSRREEFDPLANKTVLFLARDAAVTLSYTGLAFLDGIPTDEWIAASLRGDRLPGSPREEPYLVCIDPSVRDWPTLDLAMHRLAVGLEAAYLRLPDSSRHEPLGVVIAGARWGQTGVSETIIAGVEKETIGSGFKVTVEARQRGLLLASAPGHHLKPGDHLKRLHRLVDPNTLALDTLAVETALVDRVREVSRQDNAVGPHCMCVRICITGTATVTVTFRGDPAEVERPAQAGGGTPSIGYSPWIIMQRVSHAPAEIGGGGNLRMPFGPFALTIGGPAASLPRRDDRVVGYVQPQERRPPPK